MDIPLLEFCDNTVNHRLYFITDPRREFKTETEFAVLRLYTDKADFGGKHPRQFRNGKQIRKADMVSREFDEEYGRNFVVFQHADISGFLAEIDGIHKQYLVEPFNNGKQVEAQRPAIQNLDLRRKRESFTDGLDDMNPDPFVLQKDISYTNQRNRQLVVISKKFVPAENRTDETVPLNYIIMP